MTAPSSRATTSPLRGAAAIRSCSCQPSNGFSTSSRRSMARSEIRTFEASFSVRLMRKSRWATS